MNHRTPFYDHVRHRLRCFADDGVLEVMHELIGSPGGPSSRAALLDRADHPAASEALDILLAEAYVERVGDGHRATAAGLALLPVLAPLFQWAHEGWRS